GNNVFDVDDFDEGYLGSYLYDILRMVVSIRLLADQQGIRDEKKRDELVIAFLKSYRKKIKKFAERKKNPTKLNFTVENTKGPIQKVLKKLEKRKHSYELHKQTVVDDKGERKFDREKEKLKEVTTKEYQDITDNWDQYLRSLSEELYKGDKHYHIKDIVEKTRAGVSNTSLKR